MRDAGVETRPEAASLKGFAPPFSNGEASGRELSLAPVLVLPPRLGELRRPEAAAAVAIDRLVVPVPSSTMDEPAYGQRLWQLATASGAGVLLLGIADGADEELLQRRRLATLAALLQRRHGHLATVLARQSTWLRALQPLTREGDVVVCPAKDSSGAASRLPNEVLTKLGLPVYVLDGVNLDLTSRRGPRLGAVLRWLIPGVVLLAFGGVQGEIVLQTRAGLQALLLAGTVAFELAFLLLGESVVNTWR